MIIYVNHMAGVSVQTLSLPFSLLVSHAKAAEMTGETRKKGKHKWFECISIFLSLLSFVSASCSALNTKVITREIQIKQQREKLVSRLFLYLIESKSESEFARTIGEKNENDDSLINCGLESTDNERQLHQPIHNAIFHAKDKKRESQMKVSSCKLALYASFPYAFHLHLDQHLLRYESIWWLHALACWTTPTSVLTAFKSRLRT